MRSAQILAAAALVAGSGAFPALAEGDESAGWVLANAHCAACHDVSATGAAKTFPPSFASIAAFRGPEQIYARIVFPTMHSGMPEAAFYLLKPEEVEHLVAYIVSLDPAAVPAAEESAEDAPDAEAAPE
jgi:mono/diheme cytochrome c family protein